MLTHGDLTEAERAVWAAVESGKFVDLRTEDPGLDDPSEGATWGESRQVRAELLHKLLTGNANPKTTSPRALRLAGAFIIGSLNFEGATLLCPISLTGCYADQPLTLEGADAPSLRLAGCHVPALNADYMQTRGDVALNAGFTAQGEVRLRGAHIGGDLNLDGATLSNSKGLALYATGLVVDQNMRCRQLITRGEVRLRAANIGGDLDLAGATLSNAKGVALYANTLTAQNIFCSDGFEARGQVRLRGARIADDLSFEGAVLSNEDGVALWASELTAGSIRCTEGFTVDGEVRLRGANITGDIGFSQATLRNAKGRALDAGDLRVRNMVCNERFTANGQVRLRSAQIAGHLDFTGARLTNPKAAALWADGLRVGLDIHCNAPFSAHGEVRLHGAQVGGRLRLVGASLTNPDGMAISLERMRAEALLMLPEASPQGAVDLKHANVGTYYDNRATWPSSGNLYLDGFTYGSLVPMPDVDVNARLQWLESNAGGYTPQLYEQLSAFYRRTGRDEDARKVAIAKHRRRRSALKLPGKVWNTLLYWIVGYGYQTWKAGVWLLILLGIGWWIFDLAHPAYLTPSKPPDQRATFHAGLYALDLLLPFADLGYQGVWIAGGWVRGAYLVCNLAGWVLVTFVIGALSGLIRRD